MRRHVLQYKLAPNQKSGFLDFVHRPGRKLKNTDVFPLERKTLAGLSHEASDLTKH
jgi:hypothetical protein